MHFLRKPFLIRFASVFFLITFINSIAGPYYAFALTSGQHQPEYISYEDPSSTDMVNLLTGDFTYNMPLLTVPSGQEAGFSIPLSYHANIGPEQESSWVGLGWNINVGAITRNINGFPDDASGETQSVHVQDPGSRGWNANFLGNSIGWDSQIGHYGVLNLGMKVGYNDNGLSSVGIAGLTLDKSGASFNGAEFAITVIQVMAAIATYGGSEAAGIFAKIAMETAMGLAMDAIMDDYTPDVRTKGYWKFEKETDKDLFNTNYWVWLDKTRYEDMWGALYLDKAPVVDDTRTNATLSLNGTSTPMGAFEYSPTGSILKGSASDINIDLSNSTGADSEITPFELAYDNYNVNGPGISGSIKPYRLEVGTVTLPREMTAKHVRLSPVKFENYGSSKVPFVYEGTRGNRYFHHMGRATGSGEMQPTFYFGIDGQQDVSKLKYTVNDAIFNQNERIKTEFNTRKKIPQGLFVDWLSNGEIKSATGTFSGTAYKDYFKGQDRINFRNSFQFGSSEVLFATNSTYSTNLTFAVSNLASYFTVQKPITLSIAVMQRDEDGVYVPGDYFIGTAIVQTVGTNSITITNQSFTPAEINTLSAATYLSIQVLYTNSRKPDTSIGGYVITGADGMNYHYSIATYDYEFLSETVNVNDARKKSIITRPQPFANTWLLTAITGPDFIDRSPNGAADGVVGDNDWGYWVKFNYGKHVDDYRWRTPYTGSRRDATGEVDSYATGAKEIYYLNSVETRSHVALFLKAVRADGRSVNGKTSLRLSEINLITKDTYKELIGAGINDASGRIDVQYNTNDFTGAVGNLLKSKVIKRIVFNNNDYSLCPGVPNSSGGGKMKLASLSVLGKNDFKVFPDYVFEYGVNPAYSANTWDGWDMYGQSNGHKAYIGDNYASAWALTKIRTPEGADLTMNYERDTYGSISGEAPLTYVGTFYANYDDPEANASYSMNRIRLTSGASQFSVGEKVRVSGSVEFKCSGAFKMQSFSSDQVISAISTNYITFQPSSNFMAITCADPIGVTIDRLTGSISKRFKYGGNNRIGSIVLSDPSGKQKKTRYLYTDDIGFTSGVVSVEPEYINAGTNYDFAKYIGYPKTPVLYGRVSVLSGNLANDSDYHTKEVFEFITPDKSQYIMGGEVVKFSLFNQAGVTTRILNVKHEIQKRTNKIGKILSVKVFDKVGVQKSTKEFLYTSDILNAGVKNNQGVYTEGGLMFDCFKVGNILSPKFLHRAQRSTIISYPHALERVITTTDGVVTEEKNESWDIITGGVLETTSKSPSGTIIKTVVQPAYSKYSAMGSKAINPDNKNMLTQIAGTYSYKMNLNGTVSGLIGASANVWREDWANYRVLDASGSVYSDGDKAPNYGGIWRKADQYVWKGTYARLQNGVQTINANNDHIFNFSSPSSNPLWVKTSSLVRFNHFTGILESADMSGTSSCIKMGYLDQLPIASAVNAKYMEIAYSGAEDNESDKFFGGEVAKGNGTVIPSQKHLGKLALELSSGVGFVFKSSGLTPGRTYKASVWANSANGRIYYKGANGIETFPEQTVYKKIGGWFLIEFPDIPYSTSMEVGVKNSTGTVVYDDFRFQPTDAVLTTYVYDNVARSVTHVLDNNNLYTRYEYNDAGVVIKTYRETFKYGEKLISESKRHFKRFSIQ